MHTDTGTDPALRGPRFITPVEATADTYSAFRRQFISNGNGSAVGQPERVEIVRRYEAIDESVPIGTTPTDGLVLAELLINSPGRGDIIECGAYFGASAAKLSILVGLLGKSLYVCDSFRGLPSSDASQIRDHHARRSDDWVTDWSAGRYAADRDQVRETITVYGEPDRCHFVEGWFEDTLVPENLPAEACFVFADVDMAQSAQTCLTRLWPLLSRGGVYASHDVAYIKVLQALMSEEVWSNTLKSFPPILFGAGFGICDASPHVGYFVKGDVSPEYLKQLTIQK